MNPDIPAEFQPAIESVLDSSWSIPLWFSMLFAVAAFSFAAWIYWSERGTAGKTTRGLLTALRFLLLLSVLWMLAGWSWLKFKSEQPELAIVIDRSSSMATRDVSTDSDPENEQVQSRVDRAVQIFRELDMNAQRRLKENYRIRWFSIADSSEIVPSMFSEKSAGQLVADGLQSRLGDSLVRLVERQTGRGTAAIIFVSDGINTAGASLADAEKAARQAAIPVYSVVVGRQFAPPDVRLADLLVDREIYIGDQIVVEATVISSDVQNADVNVTLSDPTSGRTLDETQLALTSQQSQLPVRVSFVPDRSGEIELLLTVSSVEGETELSNNVVKVSVNVQDKTIRVLLVHDQPSYEFRFLKSLLERTTQTGNTGQSSFELQTVLQESDPEYVQQDRSAIRLVPSDREAISKFDIFVFGQFDPNLVSRRAQQAIFDAVTETGAGCIFVYGSGAPARELEGWPLGDLLPVFVSRVGTVPQSSSNGPFRWKPTMLGAGALPMQLASTSGRSQALWKSLPPFSTVCEAGQLKVGAQILAEAAGAGTNKPLLMTQFAGAGRVALQATDETYRWTSFGGTDLYHQRYWGQLLRWLSRGRLVQNAHASELIVEPKQAKYGQPVRFETRIGNEISEADIPSQVQLVLENNSTARTTLTLTRSAQQRRVYSATVSNLAPGNYRALLSQPVTLSPPTEEFAITTPPGEQANLRANVDAMRSLASQSRGRFYKADDTNKMFNELPRGRPTRLGSLPPIPLWNQWWVALLFVTLITAEWLIRRSVRML